MILSRLEERVSQSDTQRFVPAGPGMTKLHRRTPRMQPAFEIERLESLYAHACFFGGRTMLERPWHVLHVNANHEKRVARHLAIRSLEHYVPLYAELSQWSDRSVQLERPLFAGYVFVRFLPQARLSVISTPGVLRLLGDDEMYAVSAAEIRRIRDGLASGCSLRPHRGVSVGMRVRVRGGVFDGVEGVVTEFLQPCKVILALTAIQQSFSLEVELRQLEVLNKSTEDTVRERMLA